MYVSILIAGFFSVTCGAALTFIDGMSGGYAIALVSFFIAVSGITRPRIVFTGLVSWMKY